MDITVANFRWSKNVQKRHFLVRASADGDYETREVSSDVARGVHQFVTSVGRCHSNPGHEWVFYFMYMQLTRQRADDIAAKLVAKLCDEVDCPENQSMS
jgi:hypothetical protein